VKLRTSSRVSSETAIRRRTKESKMASAGLGGPAIRGGG
jgi:hypothetical protein